MLQGDTLTRKMYSRPNKIAWKPINPPLIANSNNGIRDKIEISLRQKFKGSVDKLEKEKKYQKFIDNILRQHVKQQKITVITNHITKKINYKSYRIVKTQQLQTNPEMHSHQSEKFISRQRSQNSKVFTEKFNESKWKSTQKKVQLPLIFKFKRNDTEVQKSTQKNAIEGNRQLKLKELRQKTLLKYIGSPKGQ